MLTYNQSNAACHIYTYKRGILSSLAHDLKLRVAKFEIKVVGNTSDASTGRNIKAVFEAKSVRTVCSMRNKEKSPFELSARDCRDIDRNIDSAVLRPAQFPEIHFRSKGIIGTTGCYQIAGELTLCGVTRTLKFPVKMFKTHYSAEVILDQRDFGITPFSALMGAMQIKPEILIKIDIKREGG